MRLLVPVLIFATMFFLSAAGSVSFFVTVPILVVMLVVAANWPWPLDRQHQRNTPPAHHPVHGGLQQRLRYGSIPGCTQCAEADPPPCDEHGARELAGIPPYYPERVIMRAGWPPELAALENLLTDEDGLVQASRAEQDARRPTNGCYIPLTDEGNTDDHEH